MKLSQLARRFLVVSGFGLYAVWIPGCLTRGGLDEHPDFSPGVQQNDIPVPLNFQFDRDQSYSLIRFGSGVGSFRSWVGYYYGDQQVGNLVPWYVEQMTVDGWTHRDTRTELARRRLTFVKGDETATVWLYREFIPRFDRYQTVVKAEIHPTALQDRSPQEILASGSTAQRPASAVTPLQPGVEARIIQGSEPAGRNRQSIPTPQRDGGEQPPDVDETSAENSEAPPSGEGIVPDVGTGSD